MSLRWSRTHDVSLIRYSGLQPTSENPGQSLLKGRRASAHSVKLAAMIVMRVFDHPMLHYLPFRSYVVRDAEKKV